jgi:hypothetical protein
MKARPVGVTILAILAGIAAVLAAIHALQFLGIIPFFIGSSGYKVHAFSFWYALMYGLLVWVYVWLTQMLWRSTRQSMAVPGHDHSVLSDPRFLPVVWRDQLG